MNPKLVLLIEMIWNIVNEQSVDKELTSVMWMRIWQKLVDQKKNPLHSSILPPSFIETEINWKYTEYIIPNQIKS